MPKQRRASENDRFAEKIPVLRTRPCAGLRNAAGVYYANSDFIMAADTASWYNNLKVAACAAARVQGTRPCANAQGFENIEPCKIAARAVLLGPLRGVRV